MWSFARLPPAPPSPKVERSVSAMEGRGPLVPGRGGKPYELISYGADGEPGGVDDGADISTADF